MNQYQLNILDFGADLTGEKTSTIAIQKAIDEASKIGGGEVIFPYGKIKTGTFNVYSNITLKFMNGSEIIASESQKDYSDTCLIKIKNAKNFKIEGKGIINGNFTKFLKYNEEAAIWIPNGFPDRNENYAWDNIHQQAEFFKPKLLIIEECENFTVQNITLKDSPFWTFHLIDCQNGVIHDVSVAGGVKENHIINSDGIDIDSSSSIRISDCFVQSSDDGICLKITKDSKKKECKDIIVSNCIVKSDESAIKIGSESYGSFKNIIFSNCTINHAGAGLAFFMRDGGIIEDVIVNNLNMNLDPGTGGTPLYIWSGLRTSDTKHGRIKNILISNVIGQAACGGYISGLEDGFIEDIDISNYHMDIHAEPDVLLHGRPVELIDKTDDLQKSPPCPFPVWSMKFAPYDLFIRYVKNIKMNNVNLSWVGKKEIKHLLRLKGIHDIFSNGLYFNSKYKGLSKNMINLTNVENAQLSNWYNGNNKINESSINIKNCKEINIC